MNIILEKEIYRKFVHLLELPIIIGYTVIATTISQRVGLLTLTALLLILLELEYLRIEYRPSITRRLTRLIERWFLRKKEKNNLVSAVFFISATIISFSIFDYPIALLALLFTVFGDLIAAFTGLLWGKRKLFRHKTYVGTFCGFLTNLLMGYFFLRELPEIFIPMAFTASVVETLTQKMDDNLTVPLFSGFIGQLLVFWTNASLPSLLSL